MTNFDLHSTKSAPDKSRALLEKASMRYGFVPNLYRILAESPAALEAYDRLGQILGTSSLTPIEQNLVLIAVSGENGCEYCVPAHSAVAMMVGAPDEVIEATRRGRAVADPRLEALRSFAVNVVRKRGWVSEEDLDDFIVAGFTKAQALEVILGVAFKTISNYTSHIAKTPLDPQFEGFRWTAAEIERDTTAA